MLKHETQNVHCDAKLLSGFLLAIIFKPKKNEIKLLTQYERITRKVLFDNSVLAAMTSAENDVIPQNGNCSRESNMRTLENPTII
jgi:hypothetical protein